MTRYGGVLPDIITTIYLILLGQRKTAKMYPRYLQPVPSLWLKRITVDNVRSVTNALTYSIHDSTN